MAKDVLTARAIEDFLINPTGAMQDRPAESRPALNLRPDSDHLASNIKDKALTPRQSFSDDPLAEQLYWRGYTSDEEAWSSVESDTMSINSASSGEILEMVPTRLSIVSAEELARSRSSIEKPFQCARTVTLKPVNVHTGDLCLSPRLVDIPPSPRLRRPSGYYRPSSSRILKLDTSGATRHQRSVASTPRTSLENYSNASTSSTPPTSFDEQSPVSANEKVIRRKSALSSMRGAARREYSMSSNNMPDAQTLREFLDSGSSSHDQPPRSMPAHLATAGKRKLRKFSSSFSLGRFTPSMAKRNDSTDSSSDEMPTLFAPSAQNARQTMPTPATYIPTRGSSLRPPPQFATGKMVPRGADERAPPIVLPPCPDDSSDDVEHTKPVRAPLRRAPMSYSPTGAPTPGRKLHRRQRSVSADDVMLAL